VLHAVDVRPEGLGAGGRIELGDLTINDDGLAGVRRGVLRDLRPIARLIALGGPDATMSEATVAGASVAAAGFGVWGEEQLSPR
jgi:hypothetical protein